MERQIHLETVRPYRLWDAVKKAEVRYRYYGNDRHAHWGALKETAWAKIGTSIEVYNCTNASHMGTYTRVISGVKYEKIRKFKDEE